MSIYARSPEVVPRCSTRECQYSASAVVHQFSPQRLSAKRYPTRLRTRELPNNVFKRDEVRQRKFR